MTFAKDNREILGDTVHHVTIFEGLKWDIYASDWFVNGRAGGLPHVICGFGENCHELQVSCCLWRRFAIGQRH